MFGHSVYRNFAAVRIVKSDRVALSCRRPGGTAFFDTNVLIYAVAEGDPRRPQAEELLASGGLLSVQVLNLPRSLGGKSGCHGVT
jgi:hypothetical protein